MFIVSKLIHRCILLLFVVGLRGFMTEPLLLTPLIEAGRFDEARQLSSIFVDGRHMGHSGFFSVPSASGHRINHMFAWFQPCLDGCSPGQTPFIQWFNGGPGSPDTVGAMNQIGNWYVDEGLVVHERCFSWCKRNNCLFVDSPVMTGFSYQVSRSDEVSSDDVEYTKTSDDATAQVLQVLLQFFRIWPEYAPAPYYVHGLSYGGKYVPSMAEAIVEHNKVSSSRINIKGLAAGDPMMDNKYQYPTYASTLYSMGVIMEDEREVLEVIMANASAWNDRDCVVSFNEWNRLWNDDGGSSCEPKCEFLFQAFTGSSNTENFLLGAQPQNFRYFKEFLIKHQKEIHIQGVPLANASLAEGGKVYFAMVESGDFCTPSAPLYTKLFLEDHLDVLVYSSNLDPLIGPPSTAAGIQSAWNYAEENLEGGAGYKSAYYAEGKTVWRVELDDVNPAGYAKCLSLQEKRFCYVIVRNAGHETTSYAPRAAFDLSERFIHRRSFSAGSETIPQCAACGGAPPLAGSSLPACNSCPEKERATQDVLFM